MVLAAGAPGSAQETHASTGPDKSTPVGAATASLAKLLAQNSNPQVEQAADVSG